MRGHFPLYVIVFISGAVVLAIEIVGTRVLGPFYGVSLFLWSALITVTLAALSVGYAVGGRWADRGCASMPAANWEARPRWSTRCAWGRWMRGC